jgi:hypothetical protein
LKGFQCAALERHASFRSANQSFVLEESVYSETAESESGRTIADFGAKCSEDLCLWCSMRNASLTLLFACAISASRFTRPDRCASSTRRSILFGGQAVLERRSVTGTAWECVAARRAGEVHGSNTAGSLIIAHLSGESNWHDALAIYECCWVWYPPHVSDC